ncbi:DoxX family protein [Oceanobacillus saliphilus]|uniref:DoxX family protein n=1 Tax=Oceanobacillus saliphilus TaxID=2925834 RepID=UPI00201DA9EE|nr:DoxX family protein [Oceanobacillus saliphilus]
MHVTKWICYAIGYVFIISGILKLTNGDFKGTFASLGLPFPELTLFLVAIAELACGMLIAGRMYMKLAVPPLILIMLGALYFTKIPMLWTGGFFTFAFNARLDIVMIILLLLLWQQVKNYNTAQAFRKE